MSEEKKYLVNQGSIRQLVGELKIAYQRVQEGIKYTEEEYKEMTEYVKQWEDTIY